MDMSDIQGDKFGLMQTLTDCDATLDAALSQLHLMTEASLKISQEQGNPDKQFTLVEYITSTGEVCVLVCQIGSEYFFLNRLLRILSIK